MKILLLFIILLSITLTLACKKEKKVDQLSLLPPATQIGTNTFGCLVNGTAFTPHAKASLFHHSVLVSDYGRYSQGYILNVSALQQPDNHDNDAVVQISTDSLKISEGITLPLTQYAAGHATGSYAKNIPDYSTNNGTATGQLTITHLDTVQRIISGTFYFKAVRQTGDTVRVTNGRFDVHYPLGDNF